LFVFLEEDIAAMAPDRSREGSIPEVDYLSKDISGKEKLSSPIISIILVIVISSGVVTVNDYEHN